MNYQDSASAELERTLVLLQNPLGDEASLAEHKLFVRYLLDHADEAHPRLLELLQSREATNPHAILDILPLFARVESLPVLERFLFGSSTNLAKTAATTLAKHPHEDAFKILLRGLETNDEAIVLATADALSLRNDKAACNSLKKLLNHPSATVRYHIIQAAGTLNCLDHFALVSLSHDPEPSIRELVARLLKQKLSY